MTISHVIVLTALINAAWIIVMLLMQRAGKEGKAGISGNIGISPVRLLILFVCFLPIITDLVSGRGAYVYTRGVSANVSMKEGKNLPVGEIVGGVVVSQTFECGTDCVTDITLTGSTYMRDNSGTLHIALFDDSTDELLDEWDVATGSLLDNIPFTVTSKDPLKHKGLKGKRLRLAISSEDSVPGNAVTVQYLEQDVLPDGELLINENRTGRDLVFTVTGYEGPSGRFGTKLLLCAELAILLQLLISVIKGREAAKTAGESQEDA